ncbi:MAG: hypothetical protein MUO76_19055 [Anaerolineaceae bacterium]|jgi:hypothetical protein|nr:hypothetical protein [Anaerolineaceae bacterium]
MSDDFEDVDGVQPENDLPEDYPLENRTIRVKALILLLVFLIPTIILLVEIATGGISLFWRQSIEPFLPQLDRIVNF